jgi:hypothetical protein
MSLRTLSKTIGLETPFARKMKAMKFWLTSSAAVVFFLSNGEMRAQSGEQLVPFNEFLSTTATAVYKPSMTYGASGMTLANAAAFAEMRQYILNMYQYGAPAPVTHSFAVGSQIYDCMPIEQQPAFRLHGLQGIAAAPPASAGPAAGGKSTLPGADQTGHRAASAIFPKGVDRFGNAIGCPSTTVPIGRITLEQITQFPTLKAFLSKSPDGKSQPPLPKAPMTSALQPPSPVQHMHDYTFQSTYNLGGNSTLSVNDPSVFTPWGEVFSLSQVWYIGFSRSGLTQTVEAGWQVYPARIGAGPHLFAYWTADSYVSTDCYDYDCGAFVQYSGSIFLGAPISPVSVPGGAQFEMPIIYEWWAGNWWLGVDGQWVGYYPGSLFGGGDMATHSVLAGFGGEIVGGNGTSYNYYPAMGDGWWGTNGWPWAAYQRQIWYIDGAYNGQWTSLGSGNECAEGTSILGPGWGGSDWSIYFFFGGPAGWCSY